MKLSDPFVVIGRLQKRIDKLRQQRDFFRQRCDHYAEVMMLHPSREREFKSVQARRDERERVLGLEQRVKEQAFLIEKLMPPATSTGGTDRG